MKWKTEQLVTFGEIMCRLCPPDFLRFEQQAPGRWDMSFGGAESNVAMSVVRLGLPATFVTVLPEHEIADACIRQLASYGVNTSKILRDPDGRMGTYFVERGANQRPSQVIYDRAWSAVSLADASAFDWSSVFQGGGWFHTTGITPALSKSAADAAVAAVQAADEAGWTVSVDLNFRKKLWTWETGTAADALAQKVMPKLLEHTHVVIGNEEDAEKTLGLTSGSSDADAGTLDLDGFYQMSDALLARFPKVEVVATTLRESISATHNNWGAVRVDRGEDPVLAPRSDGEYNPYEIRQIVDRVGGGDSFSAGLIYAMASGAYRDRQTELDFAVAASCLAHSITGDFNLTTRNEAEALMHGGGSGRVVR